NVNGTAPNLGNVTRWYISDPDSKGPKVYFGDIWLEGGATTPSASGAPVGPSPLVGYHIKGKVGNLDVDLTVTPFVMPGGAGAGGRAAVHGAPARLTRLRAAKMPKLEQPILFDTPEADAVVSALEVFPPDNPWNLVIDDWPLHPRSKQIIASVGADRP